MNELIAGVGGGAEGLCLALQQVKSRENGCLGAAAGYKINMLKTALFIQGLLDLGYDFFYGPKAGFGASPRIRSGWNWTLKTGSVLCSMASMIPSRDLAVTFTSGPTASAQSR